MVSIVRVRTVSTGVPGSPWYTNMHFVAPTTINAAGVQPIVTAVGAFWNAVKARIDASVLMTVEGDVPVIDTATGETTAVVPVNPVAISGGNAGTALPPFSQVLVRLSSGVFVGGRQIRGRYFVGGLCTDGIIANGTLNVSVRADFQTAAQTLRTTANQVIYSKKSGTAPSAALVDVWDSMAVLRSRRD